MNLSGKRFRLIYVRRGRAAEGSFEGVTLEGVRRVAIVFSRSTGVRVERRDRRSEETGRFASLRQALFGNVVAAILLLVGGTFCAGLIQRADRRSLPLRDPAIELGTPGRLMVPPAAIQEVDELGRSLVAAHGRSSIARPNATICAAAS